MTRYEAGLDPYLNVISAQTLLLGTRQVQVSFQVQQMEASARLIEALGGGWDSSQLPTAKQVGAKSVQISSANNR